MQIIPSVPPPTALHCVRCDRLLRRSRREPLTQALAWALAGLAIYGIVIAAPFLAIRKWGWGNATSLLSFPEQLWGNGFWELAALFLLIVVLLPSLKLALLTLVLSGLRLPRPPRATYVLFRWYIGLGPWAMADVFLAGFFVAYTRLVTFAIIEIGPAVWGLAGLMLATVATDATLDAEAVWEAIELCGVGAAPPTPPQNPNNPTGCPCCGKLEYPLSGTVKSCTRCGARLWPRKPASLSHTWALIIAAATCCIFAYIRPVITVTQLGQESSSTIIAGMIELAALGWWPVAVIVFVASIAIPVFKLLALAMMLISVHRRSTGGLYTRTQIYRFVEAIGRWSMIDVLMVSILSALVQLGFIATVRPSGGAIAFAAAVLLTMLAAYSFDPRLMWDAAEQGQASSLGTNRSHLAGGLSAGGPAS